MNESAAKWFLTYGGEEEYEVKRGEETHVVHFNKRECTCRCFQLTGYPCVHAMACVNTFRKRVENYVDDCYKVETYNQVYANIIHPVPGPHDFVRTPYAQLLPPTVKRAPGRPKTKRRKTPEEHEDEKKSTRRGLTLHCSICGDGGHNKRSCKATRNAPKQSNQAQPEQGSNRHNQLYHTVASSPPTQESQFSRLTNQVQTSVVYPSHTSMKCMHILQPVSKPPKTTKRVAPLNAKKGTASTNKGRIYNSSRSNALTTCLPSTHPG